MSRGQKVFGVALGWLFSLSLNVLTGLYTLGISFSMGKARNKEIVRITGGGGPATLSSFDSHFTFITNVNK